MIIDIAVAIIVLISAFISFLRGFIREVLTIAGIIGGLAAAYFFGPMLTPIFKNWFGVPATLESADSETQEIPKLFDLVPMDLVATISAYAAIFVIFVIIISIISHLTAGAVKALGLGPVDRTFGVIFGITRAIILLGLLYLPFHLLMSQDTKTGLFEESRTHLYIEKTAIFLAGFLPNSEEVQARIDDVANEADKSLKSKLMEQELLEGTSAKDIKEKLNNLTGDTKQKIEDGYNKDTRQELEQLFEQKAPGLQQAPKEEITIERRFNIQQPSYNE